MTRGLGKGPKVDILFLDDEVDRVEIFTKRTGLRPRHVKTFGEFVAAVNESSYDVIMLDHDLGDEVACGNGCQAAKYIAENRSLFGDDVIVIIHSANSIGVANMVSAMKHADICLHVVWFAWQKVSYSEKSGLTFNI